MNSSKTVRALVEGAMMVSLSTVLSIFKLVDMPYGGSVTIASAFPMLILAYRLGVLWGCGAGLVYAGIQQLLGLSNLSYVTGWQSILAVIFLDYIIAFTLVGLGGIFRKLCNNQKTALIAGAVLVSVLRYACHVISGATVWAGLSIPNEAALIYSFGYNATYMIPETIILIAISYYLGGVLDFSKPVPVRISGNKSMEKEASIYLTSGGMFLLGVIIDTWLVAPHLQDEETGKFIISGLANVNWIAFAVVSILTFATGIAFIFYAKYKKNC